jgi:hypothetical protein
MKAINYDGWKGTREDRHIKLKEMHEFALHENQDKYASAISGGNAENDDSSLESRYVSKNPDVKVALQEKPEVAQ